MKNQVLVVQGALLPALEARLVAQYDTALLPPAGPARDALLAAEGARFEGLATSARLGADAALIAVLPRLQVISSFGVGLDTLDLEAARTRGIAVGYTPDVLNDDCADLAVAMMLCW